MLECEKVSNVYIVLIINITTVYQTLVHCKVVKQGNEERPRQLMLNVKMYQNVSNVLIINITTVYHRVHCKSVKQGNEERPWQLLKMYQNVKM